MRPESTTIMDYGQPGIDIPRVPVGFRPNCALCRTEIRGMWPCRPRTTVPAAPMPELSAFRARGWLPASGRVPWMFTGGLPGALRRADAGAGHHLGDRGEQGGNAGVAGVVGTPRKVDRDQLGGGARAGLGQQAGRDGV